MRINLCLGKESILLLLDVMEATQKIKRASLRCYLVLIKQQFLHMLSGNKIKLR